MKRLLLIAAMVFGLSGVEPSGASATVYVNQCTTFSKFPYTWAWMQLMTDMNMSACNRYSPEGANPIVCRSTMSVGWTLDWSELEDASSDSQNPQSQAVIYYEINNTTGHVVNKITCRCGGGEIPGGCTYTNNVGNWNIGWP